MRINNMDPLLQRLAEEVANLRGRMRRLEIQEVSSGTGTPGEEGVDIGKIVLIHPGGETLTYPVSNTGLTQSLEAAAAGDVILVPPFPGTPGTVYYEGSFTIPALVHVRGYGSPGNWGEVLVTGKFVVNDGCVVEGFNFRNGDDSANMECAIDASAVTTWFQLTDCHVEETNYGAGKAAAVINPNLMIAYNCFFSAYYGDSYYWPFQADYGDPGNFTDWTTNGMQLHNCQSPVPLVGNPQTQYETNAAFDITTNPTFHASDIEDGTFLYHNNPDSDSITGLGILVYYSNGDPITEQPATDLGLDSASAAAGAERIVVPNSANLTANHTLAAGVTYEFEVGATVSGQMTLGIGTAVHGMVLSRTASGSSEVAGVVTPSTGTYELLHCTVIVSQSGSGDAAALLVTSGDSAGLLTDCKLSSSAASGTARAVRVATASSGTVTMTQQRLVAAQGHATLLWGGTVGEFSTELANTSYDEARFTWRLQGGALPPGWIVATVEVLTASGVNDKMSQHEALLDTPAVSDDTTGHFYLSVGTFEVPGSYLASSIADLDHYMEIWVSGFGSWNYTAAVQKLEWAVLGGPRTPLWAAGGSSTATVSLRNCTVIGALDATQGSINLDDVESDPAGWLGTVVLWQSDRSAWDVDNYGSLHASDIAGTVATRHLPLPSTSGNLLVDRPSGWQGESLSDLGLMSTLVYDADQDGIVDNTETFMGRPVSDFVLKADLEQQHEHVINESLTSQIGVGVVDFDTTNLFVAGTTQVFLNGLLQDPGTDYTEDAGLTAVHMTTAPLSGDSLLISYIDGGLIVVVPDPPPAPDPGETSGPYTTLAGTETLTALPSHQHSTESDGTSTPTALTTDYHALGIEAFIITDHDKATAVPGGIVTAGMLGIEIGTTKGHLVGLGLDSKPVSKDYLVASDEIRAQGGLPVLCHPHYTVNWTTAEIAAMTGVHGIEIFNEIVAAGAPETQPGFAVEDWDTALSIPHRNVWAIACDDYHNTGTYKRKLQGVNRVWVPSVSDANLRAALVAGNFVADVSNDGVTPGIPTITHSGVSVTCPGAVAIRFIGDNGALLEEDTGSSGSYTFLGTEGYVRIEAVGDYTETFASALPDTWKVTSGTWTVTGGLLHQAGTGGPYYCFLRRYIQGDQEAQVDLRFPAPSDYSAGFQFNHVVAGKGWLLNVNSSGAGGDANTIKLHPRTSGTEASVASSAVTIAQDTWYTLKMAYTYATGRVRGKVWERGTTEPDWQIDYSDATKLRRGMFSLRCREAMDFDNFYIKGYKTYYQPIPTGDWS